MAESVEPGRVPTRKSSGSGSDGNTAGLGSPLAKMCRHSGTLGTDPPAAIQYLLATVHTAKRSVNKLQD